MIYLPLLAILFLIAPAISAIAILRSPSLRWHGILLGICIFYGISPLLIAWGGMSLAKNFNCSAEAAVFTCSDPSWLGSIVTVMFFAHWLAIVTIPSTILGCVGLLISAISKRETIMNTPNNPRVSYSEFPKKQGQLTCPHCYYSFPLTWHQYWSAPLGNHRCPQCRKTSYLKANDMWLFPMQIIGVILLLGIPLFILIYIFHYVPLGGIFLLIGILGVIIFLDKWMDGRFKKLRLKKVKQ